MQKYVQGTVIVRRQWSDLLHGLTVFSWIVTQTISKASLRDLKM